MKALYPTRPQCQRTLLGRIYQLPVLHRDAKPVEFAFVILSYRTPFAANTTGVMITSHLVQNFYLCSKWELFICLFRQHLTSCEATMHRAKIDKPLHRAAIRV